MIETAPEFFDRIADRYDQVVPFFAELSAKLLDILDPAAGTRLLDLGTGRGAIATAAAARECTVTAVDAAPRMVELLAAAHPEIDARVTDHCPVRPLPRARPPRLTIRRRQPGVQAVLT